MEPVILDISQVMESIGGLLALIGFPMAIFLGVRMGNRIIELVKFILLEEAEKTKRKNTLDAYSVPYHLEAEPEKPKRQVYMTIGDDGELVEMDE